MAAVTSTTCQEVQERVTRGDYGLLLNYFWKASIDKSYYQHNVKKGSESICC